MKPSTCNLGFTLIELALSVFVMGVAILGIFGLSRLGLDAAAEAEDETRAAMFADDVFTTLRLYSDAMRSTNDTDWIEFWENIDTNEFAVAGCDFWQDRDGDPLTVIVDGELHTNEFYSVDIRDEGDKFAAIPEYALHYRVRVAMPPFSEYETGEYSPSNAVRVSINVWNGGARRRPDAYTFYTHFVDGGLLP